MRPKATLWKDAFVVKMHNRRIVAKQKKHGWFVTIVKLWKEPVKDAHFDKVIRRGSCAITIKYLNLSEEALLCLSEGFLAFKHAHGNLTPSTPGGQGMNV